MHDESVSRDGQIRSINLLFRLGRIVTPVSILFIAATMTMVETLSAQPVSGNVTETASTIEIKPLKIKTSKTTINQIIQSWLDL